MKRTPTCFLVSSGLFVSGLLLSSIVAAQAVVHRCVDPDTGSVTFSQVPCRVGQESSTRIVRPNSIDASGSREQVMQHEIRQLRSQVQTHERRLNSPPSNGMTQPDLQAQRIDSRACEQARRAYEIESSSIINDNREVVLMKREAMYGACGMREPDRTEINVTSQSSSDRRRVPYRRSISVCDDSGCWDNFGQFYAHGAGPIYHGPTGSCEVQGGTMYCF